MNQTLPKAMTVLEAYNDLNDTKKKAVREAFVSDHGFETEDTFYKKIKRETRVRPNERKWLSTWFNLPESELFPEMN